MKRNVESRDNVEFTNGVNVYYYLQFDRNSWLTVFISFALTKTKLFYRRVEILSVM